jgi:sarcosine/dimethylglycine N-methyltransferase
VRSGLDGLVASNLAPIEHFHTLGQRATEALAERAAITTDNRVLDAGGGIGGTARLPAGQIGCRVSSIDLTTEYCDLARWLNTAVGLNDLTDAYKADALDLASANASFDVVVTSTSR